MTTRKFTKAAQEERSTPASEFAAGLPGSILTNLVPGGQALDTTAYLAGLLGDEDNRQRSLGIASFMPGVSAFKRGNRIKTQVNRELRDIASNDKYKGARPVAHAVAEHLGPGTSVLASGGLGAVLGSMLSKDKGRGATVGGALGVGAAGLGHLAAMIAAAAKRRRTKEEQIEADKGSLLAKYLVPGKAAYGNLKRLGRSQGERDEDSENGKSKETQKKAYAMGFAKVAEASGADPEALAKYALELKKKEKPNYSFRNTATGLLGTLGTSTASSTVAGAGLGALVGALSRGRINPASATEIGAGLGLVGGHAANAGGGLAALFTKTRSKAEQAAYDREGHTLKNLLLPGYGTYNNFKRLGRAIGNTAEG